MLRDHATQAISQPHGAPARRLFDPRSALACLPPLCRQPPSPASAPCKICGAHSFPFDRVDFNKYCNPDEWYEFGLSGIAVDYLRCSACGFLFTTFCDLWEPKDFRSFVYNDDYIKVDGEYAEVRPVRTASRIAGRFKGAEEARILDYGSGSGVFPQYMREAGFRNVEAFDPFSSPERPDGKFDIVTCFEVIEHTPDPRMTFADLISYLRPDGYVLLGQMLQPDDILSIRGNWWYLAPRNGHLSTYTEEALELLGREYGLLFYRGDDEFGFAGPSPGRFAQTILASVGPSFSTLRLLAPAILEHVSIVSPDRSRVVWHCAETLGVRKVRWTGGYKCLGWRAKWSPVSRLRVQIPVAEEVVSGFAQGCTLSLDGIEAPVKRIRGDLTAEFDVDGKTHGDIQLITPEAVTWPGAGGRALGVAIPVGSAADQHGAGFDRTAATTG